MSSRLLTMKFMQRAAATTPASSPSTPKSEEQTSKRQKLSHNSPTTEQNIDALVDQAAIKKALAEEERKREEALVRNAAESGDARWVLTAPNAGAIRHNQVHTPLNVVQVGFAQIDSPNTGDGDTESQDSEHNSVQPFRRFNMDKKKARCFATRATAVPMDMN